MKKNSYIVRWSYEGYIGREEGTSVIKAVDEKAAEKAFYKNNPMRIENRGYIVEGVEIGNKTESIKGALNAQESDGNINSQGLKHDCSNCTIKAGEPECWVKECGKTMNEKQYAAYLADNYQDPRD